MYCIPMGTSMTDVASVTSVARVTRVAVVGYAVTVVGSSSVHHMHRRHVWRVAALDARRPRHHGVHTWVVAHIAAWCRRWRLVVFSSRALLAITLRSGWWQLQIRRFIVLLEITDLVTSLSLHDPFVNHTSS